MQTGKLLAHAALPGTVTTEGAVSGFSRETESIGYIDRSRYRGYRYRPIATDTGTGIDIKKQLTEELAQVIMQAERACDQPPARWEPRRAGGVTQSSQKA